MPVANGIHYETEGSPGLPALIFSNSLGTTLEMWNAQAREFGKNYHVVRYDTRGHGRSSSPTGPYTLAQLGGDVLALMDYLSISHAHFCGLSMGGLTAQWLGIYAYDRMDKLVIANSAARVGTADGWEQRARLARGEGLGGIADGAAGRWFTPDFIAREPGQVAALVETMRQGSADGYAACCEALAVADLRDKIQTIPNATLIIAGAHDPVTTPSDAVFMQQKIRGAATVTLAASHISNIEAPDTFNQALAAFLR
ncbi:3-oxoadipate enol-lactonase [Burkholderia sp. LMU1-1-1.1]|uniref:3-oxoadipate enol-lactonase n=1 Tax=Burkholderia sp. LMU1-1-1.1 TaxID=3135266 RepID=UPI003447BC52